MINPPELSRTGSPMPTTGCPAAANAAAAGAYVAAPLLHPGATCHVPFDDWTKPYVAAIVGLPKISGWWAGLTPAKLHAVTAPWVLVPPPYCANDVEAVPKTAPAATAASRM